MSRHRVEITFEDGTFLRLICPESGCEPPEPGEGSEPDDECWIKSWFDNCTAEELLDGTIEVLFDAEADDGGPTFTVIDAHRSLRSKVEREIEQLRERGKRTGALGHWAYSADRLQAILDSDSEAGS